MYLYKIYNGRIGHRFVIAENMIEAIEKYNKYENFNNEFINMGISSIELYSKDIII